MYGDKEKFVTSAYKKKLQEDAQWLAEEKLREEREKEEEVRAIILTRFVHIDVHMCICPLLKHLLVISELLESAPARRSVCATHSP